MMVFRTDRIQLRPYADRDFPHIFRLQSDGEVMRYIRAPVTDATAVLERTMLWLKYAEENPGFGVWTIENLDNHGLIGYAVLRHVEFQPGRAIEIGYTLDKECWGKGYATEATQLLMNHAFKTLGVTDLVAYTDEANGASNRVLEKCGFQRAGKERVYDADCLRWEKKVTGDYTGI